MLSVFIPRYAAEASFDAVNLQSVPNRLFVGPSCHSFTTIASCRIHSSC